MLQLQNNCRAGQFSVYPSNWKSSKASLKKIWRITYWFYDDNLDQKKQIVIKGMNQISNLAEKQANTASIIESEIELLTEKHFNYITKKYFISDKKDITENTSLMSALYGALDMLAVEAKTRTDIKNKLGNIAKAAGQLNYTTIPVGKIRRKNIVLLLDQCGRIVKNWTGNNYNSYRNYLSILFTKLRLIEAVDTNHVKDIPKMKIFKRIRLELSLEERIKVDKHLHDNYYSFWIFLQIFFHSGSRESELMNLRGKDVFLDTQYFKRTIKKGQYHFEKMTPIKDVALIYWKEAFQNCGPEDYLFSEGLVPGPVKISPAQISRRWKRNVKEKLNIQADFYSLKHSNLDETAAELSLQDASRMAGHTTPVITLLYAQNEKKRQDSRLKKVNNSFV